MSDLRTFGARIKLIGKNLETNADKLKRRVALAVDAAVVMATPVDTGRARANWQVETDGPAVGTIPVFYEGKSGTTSGQNAQAAIDQGQKVIEAARAGQAFHITNNLPYIGGLNDGYSAQAPAGFVQKAVREGIDVVHSAVGLLDTPRGK